MSKRKWNSIVQVRKTAICAVYLRIKWEIVFPGIWRLFGHSCKHFFYKLPAMSNDLTEQPLLSELLWTSLFIQRMMSLLLQGQNIEMMVILIMLKARKVDKVMNGWKMRSMSKKIARGRSECVQRTGIVSEILFLFLMFCPANSHASPVVISEQQHCWLR